jgi:hypothetical protein
MKDTKFSSAVHKALGLVALAHVAASHSWIESASNVADNGTMVGKPGFPRGYIPRTEPGYGDAVPTYLLPANGQSAYSGEEILNKFPFEANPRFPMLEAASGTHIALNYLENGHTTLPENQPNKPRNRGTIFIYGTSIPSEQEKLFDVHLRWNRDGTGGDGRGKLLATRNYDDGQCYQPNGGSLSSQRANELADEGAKHEQELACQADIKLPDDLKPGSIYTIYWYWDWPDLNPDRIDIEATKNGIFPWAGTFMRGDKDPHGFTADAIARNESYASTIDIKIVEGSGSYNVKGNSAKGYINDQNIYSKAIEEQMRNNYMVDLDGGAGNSPSQSSINSSPPGATSTRSSTTTTEAVGGGETVTVTQTIAPPPPTTVVTTVYQTMSAPPLEVSSSKDSTSWSTVIVTLTSHVQAGPTASQETSQSSVPTGVPTQETSQSSVPTGVPTQETSLSSVPTGVPTQKTSQPPVPSGVPTQKTSQPPAPTPSGRPSVAPFMRRDRVNWGFGH